VQRDIPAPTFAPPTFSGCTVSPKIVQAKIRGSANGSSMPSRPGSVMAGRAPCRSVHSENPRRGMAFGLACAFAQRSLSFGDRRDFLSAWSGPERYFPRRRRERFSAISSSPRALRKKRSSRDRGRLQSIPIPIHIVTRRPEQVKRNRKKVSSVARSNVAVCVMLSGAMFVITTEHHP
jgi:hypothetical protein